jgi:TetR/AcrR family transcriptional repressor of nem operon
MARPERGRIRKNDPVGLRARVLDAAAASFQGHGYRGTSMQDLVTAAAVTGGALHHHFPTKCDLALAVIAERVSEEVALTWIAAVEAAPTAAEGIIQIFERVADHLDDQGSVSGCPLGNLALELSLTDEGLRAAIEGEYDAWRSAIARCFERDAARGGAPFVGEDPLAYADTVVAMFTGAMSIAKSEQSARALRSCIAVLRRIMAV